ncbi:MAG: hypothetical protein WCP55_02415 [Lentisphaerota bacterium]
MNAMKKTSADELKIVSVAACETNPPKIELAGDWKVAVVVNSKDGKELGKIIDVPFPVAVKVRNEEYARLPDFKPEESAWGWQKGVALNGVKAQECTTRFALDPVSLRVASGTGKDATEYEKGRDYDADLEWASVGRLPQGRIKSDQPVFISYEYIELGWPTFLSLE